MSKFDYKRAWKELPEPQIMLLPREVHDLVQRVKDECGGFQQDENCDMRWPCDTTIEHDASPIEQRPLWKAFEAVPLPILAWAARVVYFWGHWGSSGCGSDGFHWKFSNYADQVIRTRLGLPRSDSYRGLKGVWYKVHDGSLRVGIGGQWEEIGFATSSIFELVKLVMAGVTRNSLEEKAITARAQARKTIAVEVEAATGWFNTEKYMVDDSPEGKLLQEWKLKLSGTCLTPTRTGRVNYKPHPFVIGPRHMVDGRIDPDAAPCCFKEQKYGGLRCSLSYAEHTSELALFVAPSKQGVTSNEIQEVLKPLAADLESSEFEGVALEPGHDEDGQKLTFNLEEAECPTP